MSTESNAKIHSVVGGCRREGRWLVPAETSLLALFGRAVVDLRDARTTAETIDFTCMSVFAKVTFIVPEGAEIRPSGMAVFGSARSFVPHVDTPCALPPMSIDAVTVFGRLRIQTVAEADMEKPPKRKWFRRSKSVDEPTDAGVDFTDRASHDPVADGNANIQGGPDLVGDIHVETSDGLGTVDLAPVSSRPATEPVPSLEPVDLATVERPDEPAGVELLDSRPPVDLSAPIERFDEPDDVSVSEEIDASQDSSPLNDVDVPESLSETILDDAHASEDAAPDAEAEGDADRSKLHTVQVTETVAG